MPLGGNAGTRGLSRLARAATGWAAGRLDALGWKRLGRVLAQGAVAAGFETEQWTLCRMAALIRREFGVVYHPRYLERPLKAIGFSVQRPATRRGGAMSRRSLPGRAAPGRPSKNQARREGRTIVFLDEAGHSFRPARARPGRGAGSPRCCSR